MYKSKKWLTVQDERADPNFKMFLVTIISKNLWILKVASCQTIKRTWHTRTPHSWEAGGALLLNSFKTFHSQDLYEKLHCKEEPYRFSG